MAPNVLQGTSNIQIALRVMVDNGVLVRKGTVGQSTLIPPTPHLQADSSKVNGLVFSARVVSTDNMPMGLPKQGRGEERRREGREGKRGEGRGRKVEEGREGVGKNGESREDRSGDKGGGKERREEE